MMHVENPVAVIRDHTLAPARFAAEFDQFTGDETARHRHHLNRQREAPQHRHLLCLIDNADEFRRTRRRYLFPRQRRAAALDHRFQRIDLVAAIHIHIQPPDRVQIADAVTERLQAARAFLRRRDNLGKLQPCRTECLNKAVHRRAAADAQRHTVFYIMQRLFGDQRFHRVLIHRKYLIR